MASRSKKEKVEDIGGELSSVPNEKYKKFFERFAEIETLDVKDWKSNVHILAYFVKKYEAAFGMKYQFKFNDPNPTKCYEVWRVSTLSGRISANPQILRDYIDWVFQEKVGKGKRRFNSISFIANEDLVNFYKMNVLLADKKQLHLDRSSPLPPELKKIMNEENIKVSTYGDLAFFYQSIKAGGLDEELSKKFDSGMAKMKEAGFDASILERII